MLSRAWIYLTVVCVSSVACSDDATTADEATSTSASTSSGSTSGTGGGDAGGGGQAQGGAAGAGGGGAAEAGAVACAGEACEAAEVCCFEPVSKTQVRCDAVGSCDANHIELSCDHPDDCDVGETCCSAFNGTVLTMECKADCSAADEYVMCSGPDQAACPANTTCSNAQAGQGYHYCAK